MSWFPRWIYWLFLVHFLVLVIVALIMTKRARLQAPLCERHQWHWVLRQGFIGFSFLALIIFYAGLVAFFMNAPRQQLDLFAPLVIAGTIVLMVAWLVAVIVAQSTAIRAAEITKTHILLAGVSEAFVQAVEEAEIERRVRLRQWEDDDAESVPRRRHARDRNQDDIAPRLGPPPDAFTE
jgi:hypothetical protein